MAARSPGSASEALKSPGEDDRLAVVHLVREPRERAVDLPLRDVAGGVDVGDHEPLADADGLADAGWWRRSLITSEPRPCTV